MAIVAEWLTGVAGAEMVLKEMLAVYPQADLFALIDTLNAGERAALGATGREIRTTWMQRIPGIGRRYRQLLPLMPLAVRGHDLRGYDVVISSAHAMAHRVRVPATARHLVYCHTPIRYAWDLRERYLEETGLDRGWRGWGARTLLEQIRRDDAEAGKRPHAYAVNSRYIQARVRRCYERESKIIHPPVDTEYFTPSAGSREQSGGRGQGGFYVTVSRMVPYKMMPLIAEAFSKHLPDRQLVVMGDGPEMAKVRAASGPNVQLLGAAPRDVLRDHLRQARAFVFAAEEDFGILPVEAQACGTPVIAYGVGGVQDSVVDGVTGVFFGAQTAEAIAEGVRRLEGGSFSPKACRANAERFSVPRFRAEFRAWVESTAPVSGAG